MASIKKNYQEGIIGAGLHGQAFKPECFWLMREAPVRHRQIR
ncbi:hypothetical protein SORDD17_00654 [Streptococcus oralis]|uniref:Uncharacterized protein n=1 Tax=Streptococcus oralis TaxID=1303 RepID=A0A139RMZ2_STROR|nr:hypothetical protein [Streptococcus oralis]KXT80936.1 hypothetical protein SORDD15_00986 [Streptococcus oralis]KXU16132.1 hypothetical protein SORDD17_00654 [Streptococcus oralis]